MTDRYEPEFDEYATRVSSLRKGTMLWEWDVPRGDELRPDEATTRESWEETTAALREGQSPDDHEDLYSNARGVHRMLSGSLARLTGWATSRRKVQ